MDTYPPNSTVVSPPRDPGFFGTKLPSSIAFLVGILLFFLPFSEIKCGGSTIANKTGLDYAMGKEYKIAGQMKGLKDLGGTEVKETTKPADKQEKGNTQIFVLAAAGLAILGLLLSLGSPKMGAGGLIMGILSAGALIALMMEAKKLFNNSLSKQAMEKGSEGADSLGFDKMGDTLNKAVTQSFTPWFYLAIILFLAAGIFSYMRSRSVQR